MKRLKVIKGRGGFRLEVLESRLMLSFDPSPFEQELLEHVNRMRIDPQGELAILFSSLSPLTAADPDADSAIKYFRDPTSAEIQAEWSSLVPVPPLAWHSALHRAATNHSLEMLRQNAQEHRLPGESSLGDRAHNAGYGSWTKLGENIFAYAKSAFNAHSAFAIDWQVPDRGHRDNIMDPDFWEIGIGIVADSSSSNQVGPLLVTQDFGDRASLSLPYLLGVAFVDSNRNGWYDAGEGAGGANIQIVGATGTYSAVAMSAGGYQANVPNGVYTVTASGGRLSAPMVVENVVISGGNVKVDFVDVPPPNKAPLVDLNGESEVDLGYETALYAGEAAVDAVASLAMLQDDSGTVKSLTVSLVSRLDGQAERLMVDTTGTRLTAAYDPTSGTLIVSGDGLARDFQSVLRTLRYVNDSPSRTAGMRQIEVVAFDGEDQNAPAIAIVNVLDTPPPKATVGNVTVVEGDGGGLSAVFTVVLSAAPASGRTTTLSYSSEDWTASAGIDYDAVSGRLSFTPTVTAATVSVAILSDTVAEGAEAFFLNLGNPSGLILGDTRAVAEVIDDDTLIALPNADAAELKDLDLPAGRHLFRFDISHDGVLAIVADFEGVSEQADVKLYPIDRAGEPLNSSTLDPLANRVEWEAQPGSYILEVSGTAAGVDLRLANVIQRNGSQLVVVGTAIPDDVEIDVSDGVRVVVNGVPFSFSASEITAVVFQGDGTDTARLLGGAGSDRADLYPSGGTLVGAGYRVSVSGVYALVARGGGGEDVAQLFDSPEDDTFYADQYGGRLTTPLGAYAEATGFRYVHGYSSAGGSDEAYLSGTQADEQLVATDAYTKMVGLGFFNRAKGFDKVYAASGGGADQAHLYATSGVDQFRATSQQGEMSGSGYYNRADGYYYVHAYGRGGNDTATLMDSSGSDTLVMTPLYARLFGAGYMVRTKGFAENRVEGSGQGADQARFYDSQGNDTFTSRESWSEMAGPGYRNSASAFRSVQGFGDAGGYDVAHVYDSVADDTFTASSSEATMRGGGSFRRAARFEEVHGYSLWGGRDVAEFYDSAGDDTFIGRSTYSRMLGSGYAIRAKYFDTVLGKATAGGNDVAWLYDSGGDDTLAASATESTMAGNGFVNRVSFFESVYAQATAGGNDEAIIASSGDPDEVVEQGSGWIRLSNARIPVAVEATAFVVVETRPMRAADGR